MTVAQEEISATGHRYSNLQVIPATCTEDAYIIIGCGNCGGSWSSANNDQEALDFVETNLSIGISPSYTLINGMYRLRCINTAMNQFHRIGKVLYKESLSILLEAWKDNPKALHGAVVETMCTFVKTYMGEYNHEWLVRKLSYSNPYDIVIKAKSLDTDGGPKSALQHILDIYNYNNPKPLPVSF
jgi:hypothetical protein